MREPDAWTVLAYAFQTLHEKEEMEPVWTGIAIWQLMLLAVPVSF